MLDDVLHCIPTSICSMLNVDTLLIWSRGILPANREIIVLYLNVIDLQRMRVPQSESFVLL